MWDISTLEMNYIACILSIKYNRNSYLSNGLNPDYSEEGIADTSIFTVLFVLNYTLRYIIAHDTFKHGW